MVERHSGYGRENLQQRPLKLMNNFQARMLLKLMPRIGAEFPHYTLEYFASIIGCHEAYLKEQLDFLEDKDLVTFDEDGYSLSTQNIWNVSNVLKAQDMVILARKIQEMESE